MMVNKPNRNEARLRRHRRVRGKISGTASCPRLDVFRSNAHIYAQVIDDVAGVTLASASSMEKEFEGAGNNIEAAVLALQWQRPPRRRASTKSCLTAAVISITAV